nr:DMT family transporter [uncultured Cohaesibacter sp.]
MTRYSSQQTGAAVAIQQTMGKTEWVLLIVLSVLWGGSFLFVGVAVRELPTLTIVLVRVGLAAIVLWSVIAIGRKALPRKLSVWLEAPFSLPLPSATTLAALVALALLSTAVAYILYFHILAKAGATNVLLVTFLTPVSAILLGTLILGDHLTAVHLAGMVMIGLGLMVIDGRLTGRFLRQ